MKKRILQAVAAFALVAGTSTFIYVQTDDPDACDVCYRPMHAETFYRIHLDNGESKDVCCPRRCRDKGNSSSLKRWSMKKRILQAVAALALVAAVGTFIYVQTDDPEACDICYRPMHAETFYRIHLEYPGQALTLTVLRRGILENVTIQLAAMH